MDQGTARIDPDRAERHRDHPAAVRTGMAGHHDRCVLCACGRAAAGAEGRVFRHRENAVLAGARHSRCAAEQGHRDARRHGRPRPGQEGGQRPDRAADGGAKAPRAGPADRAAQPAHGLHRTARRRQDRGGARARRHLPLAAGAARRASGRGATLRRRRRLYRADRTEDAGEVQRGARRHPVHRRGLYACRFRWATTTTPARRRSKRC